MDYSKSKAPIKNKKGGHNKSNQEQEQPLLGCAGSSDDYHHNSNSFTDDLMGGYNYEPLEIPAAPGLSPVTALSGGGDSMDLSEAFCLCSEPSHGDDNDEYSEEESTNRGGTMEDSTVSNVSLTPMELLDRSQTSMSLSGTTTGGGSRRRGGKKPKRPMEDRRHHSSKSSLRDGSMKEDTSGRSNNSSLDTFFQKQHKSSSSGGGSSRRRHKGANDMEGECGRSKSSLMSGATTEDLISEMNQMGMSLRRGNKRLPGRSKTAPSNSRGRPMGDYSMPCYLGGRDRHRDSMSMSMDRSIIDDRRMSRSYSSRLPDFSRRPPGRTRSSSTRGERTIPSCTKSSSDASTMSHRSTMGHLGKILDTMDRHNTTSTGPEDVDLYSGSSGEEPTPAPSTSSSFPRNIPRNSSKHNRLPGRSKTHDGTTGGDRPTQGRVVPRRSASNDFGGSQSSFVTGSRIRRIQTGTGRRTTSPMSSSSSRRRARRENIAN
jgi:hypothetical protein